MPEAIKTCRQCGADCSSAWIETREFEVGRDPITGLVASVKRVGGGYGYGCDPDCILIEA